MSSNLVTTVQLIGKEAKEDKEDETKNKRTREKEKWRNAEKCSPHDGHTVGCICWRVCGLPSLSFETRREAFKC